MTYHLLYILVRMDAFSVWIYGDVKRPSNLKGGFSNQGINSKANQLKLVVYPIFYRVL